MTNKILILVVDDNQQLLQQIVLTLEEAGYEVMTAREGQEALDKIEELEASGRRTPDLVLMDILMLPGLGGERTATLLRNKYPELAIIMMTEPAASREADMLDIADDFINKATWSMKVLLARIKKNLPKQKTAKKLISGDLEIDLDFRQAKLRGEAIKLGHLNIKVLIYLMHNPFKDIHYSKILYNVWPNDVEASENRVRIAVRRIREALQDYAKFLDSGRGEGTYRWVKNVTPIE